MIRKAAFGGGCHWCTEAVFAALKGVIAVEQGWIASDGENDTFSEGVIVTFDPDTIGFKVLISIHLHTHSATSVHSMRGKYRSAVYVFTDKDAAIAAKTIETLQQDFETEIITKVLPFRDFKRNNPEALNYYFNDPQKPFCETYINPKLKMLLSKFTAVADLEKLQHLI
ncbi:peptide methionine sulfoxide reductase MsrA [Flavobacterium noncentrifugens]|uniref:peptide-methionine (S)-S-oxide reductase n=1 Tax=Flavobacterium noncentrifugens TaxID=1128970 RepID=A0A1G8YCI5_9FLAO|nr:peptide-methionine (S)-S-oxide reductase [Flavobacterium noncentrifugens]GEP51168.1 peptide methionine sulfoxide reductase MsrA [Flavobacterium noncentrifugens]SDK00383.1 peptide-methionine (S)-S-oxide reductase [Flavobacterium noncentrifugens]